MDPLSPSLAGRAIVRKHGGLVPTDTIDISAAASVEVTSEQELYPIDDLFDGRNGPGGSCWVASTDGPQVIVLRFNPPLERLSKVVIESEERSDTCTQGIVVAGWSEHTKAPFETAPRELSYSPYGPTFHRAAWDLLERRVTHLRIRVTPGPDRRRASLTAIVLR